MEVLNQTAGSPPLGWGKGKARAEKPLPVRRISGALRWLRCCRSGSLPKWLAVVGLRPPWHCWVIRSHGPDRSRHRLV